MLDDAHCHYQEPELLPFWPEILPALPQIPLRWAVVNGTEPRDWPAVEQWAEQSPHVLPSFGLHPWYVMREQPGWLLELERLLQKHPQAGVGEFGLDAWVAGHDLATQRPIFRQHWALAQKYGRVATVHCVQAWGPLMDELRHLGPSTRGFLIHAYGGPKEMVAEFVKLGAYFSFSPYFLNTRKFRQREAFAEIPISRLLIETDAPALYPPPEANRFPLMEHATGLTLNHPANLRVAFDGLAALRGLPDNEMARHLQENFNRLWRIT
jgi:TatD DNase family protein